MPDAQAFPEEEYEDRLAAVRRRMREQGLDALLVTKPENIFYLSGLDHQGFFAYHLLIVPSSGPLCLIVRRMERATVEAQAPHVEFVGYADGESPAAVSIEALRRHGLAGAHLGIEKLSSSFPPYIYERITEGLANARWQDASRVVDELRLVKSPRELDYVRRAAQVSDIMMRAAIETARPGANEKDVAAEVHRAMILAGGEPPGFSPLIRPTPRLNQEHTTWRDRELVAGEGLFLEMAGCVRRYHAPVGRFVYLGEAPKGTRAIREVCIEAFDAVVDAIRPDATAAAVYQAWQGRVDAAGLSNYRRHHCGYIVGLGFPPSWTGGNTVVGLRHDSDMVLQPGMVFHLLSWLMGTGRGDYFVSNTAVLTEAGCEVLTKAETEVKVT